MISRIIYCVFRKLAFAAVILPVAFCVTGALADSMKPLTVVELFTSQGCSSCPPANANLIEISKRPGVLALSYGVTYWDRLGWKDTFAKPEFTRRQELYEKPLGEDGPFTPQMVVNGSADVVGNKISEVNQLISKDAPSQEPAMQLDRGRLKMGAGLIPEREADIWLVTYDERTIEVPVGRGENSGHTLPHKNVVRSLTRIGSWKGSAMELAIPATKAGLRTAVLVQLPQGGPILAAATD